MPHVSYFDCYLFSVLGLSIYLIVVIGSPERRVYAPKTLMRRHRNRYRRQPFKPMVDHTKSVILKNKPDEAYRRLQQGFEALRPAFLYNCRDNMGTGGELMSFLAPSIKFASGMLIRNIAIFT